MRALAAFGLLLCAAQALAERHVVIVEGLGGEPRYRDAFSSQVDRIADASRSVADERLHVLRDATRDAVMTTLAGLAPADAGVSELALYLVGHGSYDDVEYKFNLNGPDLTGGDIADALAAQSASTVVFVNTSSASGALEESLTAEGRVLMLATRSGIERHATHFGGYFAEALSSDEADTDKNGMISAAEAFRYAARRVSDYFDNNVQLATERAKLIGDRAERVTLARLSAATTPVAADDELENLVRERTALNDEIESLRVQRASMAPEDYRSELLALTLALARVEDAIEARQQALGND